MASLVAAAVRGRLFAGLVTGALLAVVGSPVLRSPSDDDFPLSTYPMFATPRDTRQTLDYAWGETRAGERRALPPPLLGTGEILQAMRIYEHAVAGGKRTLEPLCVRLAAAVAADARYADVAVIHIVTGTHDAIDYLVRDQHGEERERVRCRVMPPPRRAP